MFLRLAIILLHQCYNAELVLLAHRAAALPSTGKAPGIHAMIPQCSEFLCLYNGAASTVNIIRICEASFLI